jgi:Domain of Unknown Function (DUF1080)
MKNTLFRLLLLFALAAPLSAEEVPLNQLSDTEKAAGWQLLFDGKDASQWWRGYNKDILPEGWKAEDGALTCHKGGDIVTKEEFDSFELSLDWKIGEAGNSGVMFKVHEGNHKPGFSGPEAQILDNIKGKDPQKAGWVHSLYAASVDTTKPVGEWNHLVIKCQKTPAGTYKCENWLNGTKYVEYEIGSPDWFERVAQSKFAKAPDFAQPGPGHIDLQDHGDDVAFRNIKIRPLPAP